MTTNFENSIAERPGGQFGARSLRTRVSCFSDECVSVAVDLWLLSGGADEWHETMEANATSSTFRTTAAHHVVSTTGHRAPCSGRSPTPQQRRHVNRLTFFPCSTSDICRVEKNVFLKSTQWVMLDFFFWGG